MPNQFDKEREVKAPQVISEDLRLAVAFFRKHEYHLPSITQSNEGLRFATRYWLDPIVKSDKSIYSQLNSIKEDIEWVLYDPSQHKDQVAPPTEPPAEIPAPYEEQWQLFDPTPYLGSNVPPTDPPSAIPAPEQVDKSIIRYEDKEARRQRELEQKQETPLRISQNRNSLYEPYEVQEFKKIVIDGVKDIIKKTTS